MVEVPVPVPVPVVLVVRGWRRCLLVPVAGRMLMRAVHMPARATVRLGGHTPPTHGCACRASAAVLVPP